MIDIHSSRFRLTLFLLLIVLVAPTAYISIKRSNSTKQKTETVVKAPKKYVCSMHPQVVQDKPGDCPLCGMALIERIDNDANSADTVLNKVVRPVNEAVLASVQTVSPNKEELPLTIEASGLINFDTRRISTVSARFGGLIEKSYVKYAFQPIHKGEKIYDIYCPDIYFNKINYIQLMRAYPEQAIQSKEAREWLENLGLTDQQIKDIIEKDKPNYHLSVYSDREGFAVGADFSPEQYFNSDIKDNIALRTLKSESIGIELRDGVVVESGKQLFKIINSESVRADLKIRTEDVGLLKIGQRVMLSDAVSPERVLNATVSQIEPLNGSLFQLVKVYITDPRKILIPGRQIQALIRADKHKGLWLPKTAVINLGQHQTVFQMRGNSFIATKIKTGLQSGDKIEICSGIDQNSKIALNASLLTDSDGFIKTASR